MHVCRSFLVGLALLCAREGLAAELPIPPEAAEIVEPFVEPRWSFAVAPYLWAAGISGDVAQFGVPPIEVDADFSDIFDNLDFGAMIVSELRYDRFGLFTDLVYVKLSAARGTPHGILADRVSLDSETLVFTGAGEYRVVDAPRGSIDVMAGARIWAVETGLGFRGGLLDGLELTEEESWVDPLVGAKGRFDLTPKLYLTGWAMAGGFGVSSDSMWDLFGGAGFQFNDHFSAVLGYRGMGVDYENDGFVFDVIQHGPVFGGVIRF